MKQLKILGLKIAEFGDAKNDSSAGRLRSNDPANAPIPTSQLKYLNPRYEPGNITQNANVLAVQDAIRQAENGDTLNLFRFYRDVLLSDDHVQSCFNLRKLAVLAQPLAILPRDKNNPDDVALARAMNRAKTDCENWNAGMNALMAGNLWPVSVVERLFKPANSGTGVSPVSSKSETNGQDARATKLQYTLKRFVPVNPQLLCYRWAYLTGGVGLGVASAIQLAGMAGGSDASSATGRADLQVRPHQPTVDPAPSADPYQIDLERWEPWLKLWPVDGQGRIIYDVTRAEPLDPHRHITHRGHMLTEFRDNWGGPLRTILMWWLFRALGREWFSQGMEHYGNPFPVAYTDVQDPSAVALLHQAFDLAKTIGGLVVDESSRIELKEAMVTGMAQGHETFCRLCNDAISFHITGLKESQKPAGLNAGQSNFSASVREDVRMYDQITLAETCERQIAIPFRDINGLAGNVKFIWGGLGDADVKTFSDFLGAMKNAGWTPTEDAIPTIEERTGMPFRRIAAAAPKNNGEDEDENDGIAQI